MGSEPEPEPGVGTGSAGSTAGSRVGTALSATAVGLVGFLSLVAWQLLLGSVVLSATGSLSAAEETLLGTLALGLGMGSTALAYLRFTDRGRSFVDLATPTLRDAGYAVAGVLVLFGASLAIRRGFAAAGVETAQHGITETARGAPWILLVLIPASWLLVGPGEELLFRNVVQKSLYRAFSRPAAIGIASAVFAAVHLPAYATGTPLQALASLSLVFSLSLVLGAVYAHTENLLVPAFVHGTYNAVQFALLYVDLGDGTAAALLLP